ncbi:MAG TPA: D-glycero-beta-D-manno-heptose-7-phosphate kinase [Longimicrobiales bacterium]|nr:D-glycero-beta-D-manno-heptose-7-phosphate kinase [Longimicrobiales bacterium]
MHRLTIDSARRILEAARDVRVLVLGDVMLDVYMRGAASRISPEAPVPVVRVEEQWRALGGAANVAANVAALGAACNLIGCVGDDPSGADLLVELERQGIGAAGLVRTDGRPTTVKTRVLARHQQVARFDHETEAELPPAMGAEVVAAVRHGLQDADVLVLEDYNKGLLTRQVIHDVMEAGLAAGRPIVVDPKLRHFFDYRGATVFKPNQGELAAALRTPVEADDAAWLADVREQLGCEHLLVTLGEGGMALLTSEGEHVRVPTVARSVYDVSGAGDTVTAVLAVALAAGASVVEAAMLANHAAGIEIGKAGVATVSPEELLAVLGIIEGVTST